MNLEIRRFLFLRISRSTCANERTCLVLSKIAELWKLGILTRLCTILQICNSFNHHRAQQACRSRGGRGVGRLWHPQILTDQLTQGRLCPKHYLLAPPDFQTFLQPCSTNAQAWSNCNILFLSRYVGLLGECLIFEWCKRLVCAYIQGHWTQIDSFQTNNFFMIQWDSSQKPLIFGSWDREIWYKTFKFYFINLTWPPRPFGFVYINMDPKTC